MQLSGTGIAIRHSLPPLVSSSFPIFRNACSRAPVGVFYADFSQLPFSDDSHTPTKDFISHKPVTALVPARRSWRYLIKCCLSAYDEGLLDSFITHVATNSAQRADECLCRKNRLSCKYLCTRQVFPCLPLHRAIHRNSVHLHQPRVCLIWYLKYATQFCCPIKND